jgi:hypothetical protein
VEILPLAIGINSLATLNVGACCTAPDEAGADQVVFR